MSRKAMLLVAGLGLGLAACAGGQTPPSEGAPATPMKPAVDTSPPARVRPFDPPPSFPAAKPVPIDTAMRAKAKEMVEGFASSRNTILRANAIEAAQRTRIDSASAMALRGMSDEAPVVRFSACVAAGELKYAEAKPELLKLAYDPDPNVRLAARYALHKLGDTSLSQEMLLGLKDDRAGVRGNAVMLLGMLGEKSATVPLHRLDADPAPNVRMQLNEALWRLGDPGAAEPLVAQSVSQFADDQIVALLALGSTGDRRVAEHIRGLLVRTLPEVQLAAARAAGMLGYDDGYGVASQYYRSTDPRQRGLAALAFGDIGRSDAQDKLKDMLVDPMPDVQLAAATAVLKLRAPR